MSNRIDDMRIESAYSTDVLIPDLYRELLDRKEILSYKKETSVKQQLLGVDMVLEKESGNSWSEVLLVDEKTPFNYMNGNLNTFAFELSFISRKGRELCGWFLNDKLLTTHYLCSYPRYEIPLPKRYRVGDLSTEHICNIDALLIGKRAVSGLLSSFGIDNATLRSLNDSLRANKAFRPRLELCHGMYLRKSSGLSEEPINLIIPKDLLIDISCSRFVIRGPNGFDVIK